MIPLEAFYFIKAFNSVIFSYSIYFFNTTNKMHKYNKIHIKGRAVLVKHFKILVTRFSARVSWRTGVLTTPGTFEIGLLGALGSVHAVETFIRMGSVLETQCRFRHEMNRHEAPTPNEIRRWVGQWREEGTWSAFLSSHTREHYSSFGVRLPQSESTCK